MGAVSTLLLLLCLVAVSLAGPPITVCVQSLEYILGETEHGLDERGLAVALIPGTDYLALLTHTGRLVRLDRENGTNPVLIADWSQYSGSGHVECRPGHSCNELGALSFAFHPNFPADNRLFLYFSRAIVTGLSSDSTQSLWTEPPGRWNCPDDTCFNVLASFTVDPTDGYAVDEQSERIILRIPSNYNNHNGGSILFQTDNILVLSSGDGGDTSSKHSQNPAEFRGKLLRLDVSSDDFPDDEFANYAIPPDNPDSSSVVYASGLRNPFRCVLDPLDASVILCGDVGEGTKEWSVRITAGGEDFGWPTLEGSECSAPDWSVTAEACAAKEEVRTTPFFEFHHPLGQGGSSIIGGPMIRSQVDPRLNNKYLLIDHYSCVKWDSTNRRFGLEASCDDGRIVALDAGRALVPYDESTFTSTQPSYATTVLYTNPPYRPAWPMPGSITFAQQLEDNHVYFVDSWGVYRVMQPEECGIEVVRTPTPAPPAPTPAPATTAGPPTEAPTPAPRPVLDRPVLRLPPVVCPDADGVTRLTLAVNLHRFSVGGGAIEYTARSYNDSAVGPTILVAPGGRLDIALVNELAGSAADHSSSNQPGNVNVTNLHTHGLQVSGEGVGDNVIDTEVVGEGASANMAVSLPVDHAAGTYWYHPHYHTSSGLQMSTMAGALLVGDEAGSLAEVTRDVVLLVQHVSFNHAVPRRGPDAGNLEAMSSQYGDDVDVNVTDTQGVGDYVLVNGQLDPILANVQGLTRLRLVAATSAAYVSLVLPDACTFGLIAQDGVYLDTVHLVRRATLPPGSRADYLVTCQEIGEHEIRSVPTSSSSLLGGHVSLPLDTRVVSLDVTETAAADAVLAVDLPARPPHMREAPADVIDGGTIAMASQAMSINGATFGGANSTLFNLSANTTTSFVATGLDSSAHPLHIHVSHMYVADVDSPDADEAEMLLRETGLIRGSWRDTIPVASALPVTIYLNPTQFAGRYVAHCHVSQHADRGMQGIVRVDGEDIELPLAPATIERGVCVASPTGESPTVDEGDAAGTLVRSPLLTILCCFVTLLMVNVSAA